MSGANAVRPRTRGPSGPRLCDGCGVPLRARSLFVPGTAIRFFCVECAEELEEEETDGEEEE